MNCNLKYFIGELNLQKSTHMQKTIILEKLFLICLALGLTSRAIEKGVEAGFILLAVLFGLVLFFSRTKWHLKGILITVQNFFKPWEYKLLTLAFLSFGVSSYYGIHPEYSISQWQEFMTVFIGGILLAMGAQHIQNKSLKILPKYIAMAGGAFSVMMLLEISGIGFFISDQIRDLEKAPLEMQIRSFSSVIAVTIPFAWIYALRHKSLIAWLPALLMVAGAFACGGRAGWLSLSTGFIAFFFLYDWHLLAQTGKAKALYLLHFILGSIVGLLAYKNMVGSASFTQRIELTGSEAGGSGRTDIWAFTFDKFLENPIMGIGIKGFRHLDFSTHQLTSTMHPHNALLELLLETGIVGTFLICAFAGIGFVKLVQAMLHRRKHNQNSDMQTALILCFFTFAVSSMTLTSIFHAWWLTFFVVLYVLSLKIRNV